MKLIAGVVLVVIFLTVWCCLKIGSDCDDAMGYDNFTEEATRDEKI